MAYCLNCQLLVKIESSPYLGQRVDCSNCGMTFEIIWLYPITLDYVENEVSINNYPSETINS